MTNNKIKKIYIHIGLHKTGTSSIQATLAKNKFLLKNNSIYYPTQFGINHSEFLVPMFMDNPSEYYLEKTKKISNEIIEKEYEHKRELLKSELLKTDAEVLVFSGEDISGMLALELKKLNVFLKDIFPSAEIKIVSCFREPADYVSSALQQSIKTGFCSVRPYEYKNIHYQMLIEKFNSIFDISNVIIYDFEIAKKHSRGLVGYFLENILQVKDINNSNINILRDNDSVSDITVNICGFINRVSESDTFAKGEGNGELRYERYLNDTFPLWSLKGDKFKLDKEYVESLYKKLEPELLWIKDRFGIDYNLSNASYTEERYKIPETFFETIKVSFPKLSRILRRAFYDWLCEEIEVRQDKKEIEQLEQTKNWIERSFRDTVDTNLQELKEVITNEVNACKAFFDYFKIEGKQNYQLYYHLYLFLKELGEYQAAKVMLQMYYEKNPHYSDIWQKNSWAMYKFRIKEVLKKMLLTKSIAILIQERTEAHQVFTDVFGLHNCVKKELDEQIMLFLKLHGLKPKRS